MDILVRFIDSSDYPIVRSREALSSHLEEIMAALDFEGNPKFRSPGINWSLEEHFKQKTRPKRAKIGLKYRRFALYEQFEETLITHIFHNSTEWNQYEFFKLQHYYSIQCVHKPECLIGASTFTVNGPKTNFGYFLTFGEMRMNFR